MALIAISLIAAGCSDGRPSSVDASAMGVDASTDGGASDDGGADAGGCADTESDPDNCGRCGQVCVSRQCESGACVPDFVGCSEVAETPTCDDVCAAIGGVCVPDACGSGFTVSAFPTLQSCENNNNSAGKFHIACDAPIESATDAFFARCCCQ
ncbi:MAG: hypothetical protein KC619_13920 [Myxococcales bacterium]|nr:hypothetical protein [Myxococcales bacterium]